MAPAPGFPAPSVEMTFAAPRDMARETRLEGMPMVGLINPLRYTIRGLRRSPGLCLPIVLVLAVGIGANTAIFSVLNAVLLRQLSYRDPDGLVWFYETNPQRGWDRAEVAPANFLDWREGASSFSDITAMQDWPVDLTLRANGQAEPVRGIRVFGNFFSLLGVAPALGRGFQAEESWAGVDGVAVLSDGFWRRRFGADPQIVGRSILLDGRVREVVGVMPPGFRTPEVVWTGPNELAGPVDVWIPFGWDPAQRDSIPFRQAHVIQSIGRLRDGARLPAAGRELTSLAGRLAERYPRTNRGMGVGIEPLRSSIVGHARLPLLLVMAGVGLVLLIACANVANLLLAHALGRARQLAIRAALGAGRSRIFWESMLEGLLLAVAGGVLGVLVAVWGSSALGALVPRNIPRTADMGIDGTVLGFSLAVTMLVGVLFGLAPALRSAAVNPSRSLSETGRGGEGRSTSRVRRALVAGEVGLAVVLVVGSSLLLRTLWELRSVEMGFETDGVVVFTLSLPASTYSDPAAVSDFHRELLDRAAAIPAVASVGLVSRPPLTGGWRSDFSVEGWGEDQQGLNVLHREVSPGYFSTLGSRIVAGRPIDARDATGSPLVVVVNRTLAERYLSGQSPLGRRIVFDRTPGENATWYTIVGIVEDQRQEGLRGEPEPEIFGSLLQAPSRTVSLVLRTEGEPAATIPAVRQVIGRMDDAVPISRATPLEAMVAESLARERFLLRLIGGFAVVALLLALLGVYAVTAYSVRRRTRELGIRAALGAEPRALLRATVLNGMGPVGIGGFIGLAAAAVAASSLQAILYGVAPSDPTTLAASAGLVSAAGLLACWLPARRASRVDPASALRHEV